MCCGSAASLVRDRPPPTQGAIRPRLSDPPSLALPPAPLPLPPCAAGMIDAELDERGYIVPGLGDAGDRAFGTH